MALDFIFLSIISRMAHLCFPALAELFLQPTLWQCRILLSESWLEVLHPLIVAQASGLLCHLVGSDGNRKLVIAAPSSA